MDSRLHLCNLFAISIFTFICYDWSVYFSPSGIIPDEWGLTFGMNFFTMYNYIVGLYRRLGVNQQSRLSMKSIFISFELCIGSIIKNKIGFTKS